MRRKLAALLLCLLLVFQLSPVPSGAAETVYFTAVNKNVLTLSDDTMPFWSGGYLYVPSTIFTGVGRDLGVSYYPNIARQTVLLYVDKTVYSSLVFDLNKDYAIDNEGNLYFQKPIQRGGVIFLPISLIARCFGLLYSTVEVDPGLSGLGAQSGYGYGGAVLCRRRQVPDGLRVQPVPAEPECGRGHRAGGNGALHRHRAADLSLCGGRGPEAGEVPAGHSGPL